VGALGDCTMDRIFNRKDSVLRTKLDFC